MISVIMPTTTREYAVEGLSEYELFLKQYPFAKIKDEPKRSMFNTNIKNENHKFIELLKNLFLQLANTLKFLNVLKQYSFASN